MNLSLLTNKQMEMRTDKFMIYVFSAIMLGGMVACSSDDPETDTGNGNGNGGNAEAPYVWLKNPENLSELLWLKR